MFGTFRYNKQTKNHEHVEISTANGVEARGYTSVACDYCRFRKLKCSGEKGGCDRCLAASNTCTYRRSSSSRDDRRQQRRLSSHEVNSHDWSPEISNQPAVRRYSQQSQSQKPANRKKQPSRLDGAAISAESSQSSSDGVVVTSPSSWLDPYWELPSFNDYADSDNHGLDGLDGLVDIPTSVPLDGGEDGFFESELLNERTEAADWTESSATIQPNHETLLFTNINTCSHEGQGPGRTPKGKRKSTSQPTPTSSPTSPPLSVGNKYPSSCRCLSTMAQFLESTGSHGGSGTGIDTLLACLGHGIVTCEHVLACPNCNACTDNSMLLSTLVQQLGVAAKSMADTLLARDGNGNMESETVTSDTVIRFGSYMIEMPNLRLRLVYNAILLHFSRLRGLLVKIIDDVRPDGVAWRQIISTEQKVGSIFAMIKRYLQREGRVGQ
ncbi:hypothetical protein N7471_006967 [Penicillium samsonianum]|uniref:uncharacterized protein n=1 Tax=Penicillium samsonianum TaxID=1882272 RepID=UPI002547A23D|nr:uncharacterized protein N7471_006967 [Penicillium samsonianum]KAJ6131752.1 hypothetical protein N7471_006967 [Penicillium samsonianum]